MSAADIALGRLRFTPAADANGAPYTSFTFQVQDDGGSGGGGVDLDPIPNTITINVTPVNDTPVATIVPASYGATEQTALTLAGTGLSIADVDAGSANVTATLSVGQGVLNVGAGTTGVGVAGSGSSTVTLTGTITQINDLLAANLSATVLYFNGSDTPAASTILTLSVNDGGNAGSGGPLSGSDTATINIAAVDDAPVNAVPAAQTTPEDTPLVFSAANGNQLSITDVDAGAGLVEVTLSVTYGTLTLASTTGLTFQAGANGSAIMTVRGTTIDLNAALDGMSYAPTLNYNGPALLTLVTDDLGNTGTGGPLSDSDTVAITVTPVNDLPVANDDAAAVQEDVTLAAAGDVLANDTDVDAGDTQTVTLVNGAAGNVGVAVAGTYGTLTLNSNGSYTYTLNNAAAIVQQLRAGQSVTDTFSYQMADGSAATASANLVVTITGSNDLPVANDDAAAVQEDVTLAAAGDVLANDTDVDAGDTQTVTLVNGAAGNVGVAVAGTYGTLTLNSNGSYTYTLNNAAAIVQQLRAGQSVTDTFSYQMADGSAATASANLVVTITGSNDLPVANDDAAAVQEDVTLAAAGDVLANDTDVDAGDTQTVTLVNGAAGNVGVAVAGTYGTLTLNSNGSYTYTLNNAAAIVQQLRAGQSVTDTFSYQMADGSAATASANLVVTITGSNDLPVANDDAAAVQEDVTPRRRRRRARQRHRCGRRRHPDRDPR